jgi:hypothetical protein
MNKLLYRTACILAFLLIGNACGKDFLDINVDPNNPSRGELGLVLPASQVGFVSSFLRNIDRATGAYVDQLHSPTYGRYLQVNSSFNDDWAGFYAESLKDIEAIIEEGEATNLRGYAGIAKLQKAYIYSMMVDLWGDIPYEETFKSENPTYPTDGGQATYEKLFALIDEGMADLNGTNGTVGTVPNTADIIYRGNLSRWIKMGNSLKLKMYLQTRLVDPTASAAGIKVLLANPASLIASTAEDFQFQFGTGIAPRNAHPRWIEDYNASSRSGYFANHFMTKLVLGTHPALSENVRYNVADPRSRYYLFRQVISQPAGSPNIPCVFNNVGCTYFYPGSGYLGRDKGDNSVVPADVAVSTKFGVYPAGGLFDKAIPGSTNPLYQPKQLTVNDGTGRGLYPMITFFMMNFLRAEAALTLNTGEEARTLLEAGMRASIRKVMDFGAATDANIPADLIPTADVINGYVNAVLAKYDAADAEGKLEVVIDQAYMALFGNSPESYNNFRRTGYPKLIEPVDNNAVGPFPLRLVLPIDEVAANSNAPRGDLAIKPVFWDK